MVKVKNTDGSRGDMFFSGRLTVPNTSDTASAASCRFFLLQLVHRIEPTTFRLLKKNQQEKSS